MLTKTFYSNLALTAQRIIITTRKDAESILCTSQK
jgi:hypothetical protein